MGGSSGGEARHTGHANAVTNDPEQLTRRALGGDFLEVRGTWVEALGELGPSSAGSPVAVHAATDRECASTGPDRGGVIQITRGSGDGVAVNGGMTDLNQGPGDGAGVLLRRGDIVEAEEEENARRDPGDDGNDANGGEELHARSPCRCCWGRPA
jgi:hypothetical protein